MAAALYSASHAADPDYTPFTDAVFMPHVSIPLATQ